MIGPPEPGPPRLRLTESRALGLLVVAVGAIPGAGVLYDNSLLTHLATGRIIWSGGGVPHADPYTFTAHGEPWVVQSWFASVLYGGIEELAGLGLLRVSFALTTAALAGSLWLLTRPAKAPLNRLAAVAPVLAMGAFGWAQRPYLIAFLCLAATLLAVEGVVGHRWLVPIGWLWVNTHGSWPYGVAVLLLLWLGRRLDRGDAAVERRCMAWLAAGFAVGVLNPYGPRLLVFPATAISRREAFAGIREWKPPTFDDPGQLLFIVVVGLAIVALARRPSWRATVPLVAFTAAALLSARNLPVAALVVLPGIAQGLAAEAGVGRRLPVVPVAALALALGAVALATIPTTDDLGEDPYPVAANAWLVEHDLEPTAATGSTVVALDYVGNWWEGLYGDEARVFMDDRMEIIPLQVVRDHRTLYSGEPGWEAALARYDPDAVLWEVDLPLAELLRTSEEWDITHIDDSFVVAVPAG